MTNKINFTIKTIEALKTPTKEDGSVCYYDNKQVGLCLMLTYGGSKTFYLYTKLYNRPIRVKLGKFPDTSIENARKLARENKNKIDKGLNPNDEKAIIRKDMTLKEFFNYYVENYSNKFKKEKSIKNEESIFKNHFLNSLGTRKMLSISKSDIEKLYNKIVDNGAPYQANRCISLIRAMYNKAIEWGYPSINPASNIKTVREVSRDRFLQPDEIHRFFTVLEKESNITMKNFFYLALFTGARKNNILAMEWKDISFSLRSWSITKTKNSCNQELPLIPLVIEKLQELKQYQKENNIISDYVFYSSTSKSGHLEEPKKVWNRILKNAEINNLRIHDIRRTFGSYQAIEGASSLIIGKTLGHKSSKATEIYSRLSLEPIRNSIEKATERMLSYKDK